MVFLPERQVANILISPVAFTGDDLALKQEFSLHAEKKKLFQDLLYGDATFEEVLEALETFIQTGNMDAYLLDVCPQLDRLCDFYGVPD